MKSRPRERQKSLATDSATESGHENGAREHPVPFPEESTADNILRKLEGFTGVLGVTLNVITHKG